MNFNTTEEYIEYRNSLLQKLRNNLCLVTFKKKNGESRIMLCTNSPDFVPFKEYIGDNMRKVNTNTVSVFDLNKSQYRSFLIQNLIDFKIINPKDINKYVIKDPSTTNSI